MLSQYDGDSHISSSSTSKIDKINPHFDNWQWNTPLHNSGGYSERTRTCHGPFYGGQECVGSQRESKECNMSPCPVDGFFKPWGAWGACSATCGGGERTVNPGWKQIIEYCFLFFCFVFFSIYVAAFSSAYAHNDNDFSHPSLELVLVVDSLPCQKLCPSTGPFICPPVGICENAHFHP